MESIDIDTVLLRKQTILKEYFDGGRKTTFFSSSEEAVLSVFPNGEDYYCFAQRFTIEGVTEVGMVQRDVTHPFGNVVIENMFESTTWETAFAFFRLMEDMLMLTSARSVHSFGFMDRDEDPLCANILMFPPDWRRYLDLRKARFDHVSQTINYIHSVCNGVIRHADGVVELAGKDRFNFIDYVLEIGFGVPENTGYFRNYPPSRITYEQISAKIRALVLFGTDPACLRYSLRVLDDGEMFTWDSIEMTQSDEMELIQTRTIVCGLSNSPMTLPQIYSDLIGLGIPVSCSQICSFLSTDIRIQHSVDGLFSLVKSDVEELLDSMSELKENGPVEVSMEQEIDIVEGVVSYGDLEVRVECGPTIIGVECAISETKAQVEWFSQKMEEEIYEIVSMGNEKWLMYEGFPSCRLRTESDFLTLTNAIAYAVSTDLKWARKGNISQTGRVSIVEYVSEVTDVLLPKKEADIHARVITRDKGLKDFISVKDHFVSLYALMCPGLLDFDMNLMVYPQITSEQVHEFINFFPEPDDPFSLKGRCLCAGEPFDVSKERALCEFPPSMERIKENDREVLSGLVSAACLQ